MAGLNVGHTQTATRKRCESVLQQGRRFSTVNRVMAFVVCYKHLNPQMKVNFSLYSNIPSLNLRRLERSPPSALESEVLFKIMQVF
jgi:hypothetical protein